MKKTLSFIISAAALTISASAFAGDGHHNNDHGHDHHMSQDDHHNGGHHGNNHHADMWVDGMVKKVDMEKGHIKIKHGAMKHMNMPPMTMSFKVSDDALLKKVKKGDEIKFKADKVDGKIILTEIK